MTQELADRLIADYTKVIEHIDHWYITKGSAIEFIRRNRMSTGICWYMRERLMLPHDKWILSFQLQRPGGFWFETPADAYYQGKSKEHIIETLRLRVDRLKTFKPHV